MNLDRVVYIRAVRCKGKETYYSFEFGVGEPVGYIVSTFNPLFIEGYIIEQD